MKKNKTASNIGRINRRLKLVAKLFGTHSDEYEAITNQVFDKLDPYENTSGILLVKNTKENRAQYRTISALARQITSTPVQVLKRKADKQRKEFEDYRETTGDNSLTFEAYQYWAKELNDLKNEVYQLVEYGERYGLLDPEEHNINLYLHFAYEDVRYNTWQGLGGAEFPAFKPYFKTEDYSEVEYDFDENGDLIIIDL